MKKESVQFLNVAVDAVKYNDLIKQVDSWISNKNDRSHHIATVNAYCVSLALKDKRLNTIYNSADITGADGEPFVKWMKTVKRVYTDKICARDIILVLIEEAKKKNYTFFLYGGHDHVLQNMVKSLKKTYPYLKIVGSYSPPFRSLSLEEDQKIVERINNLKPDIILVGLGTPKQDYWIDDHINSIKGSVMITCGATFDFFGGRIKMAPKWVQKSGFEWLYRLFSKDFKRLFKRYTYNHGLFIWNFILQQISIKKFVISKNYRE